MLHLHYIVNATFGKQMNSLVSFMNETSSCISAYIIHFQISLYVNQFHVIPCSTEKTTIDTGSPLPTAVLALTVTV